MADNVTLPGTGAVIATDEVSGAQYQVFKLAIGADGAANLVADGYPLPAAVAGKAAHDAAVSGNPLLLAGAALAIGQATADVSADGDVVRLLATRGGRLYVSNAHPNRWQSCHPETGAVTNHELKAAPGAGLSLYITDVIVNAAVSATLQLLDGSGGSVVFGLPSIAAGGGAAVQFHTPLKLTANTALCMTTTGAGNLTVTCSGFISA